MDFKSLVLVKKNVHWSLSYSDRFQPKPYRYRVICKFNFWGIWGHLFLLLVDTNMSFDLRLFNLSNVKKEFDTIFFFLEKSVLPFYYYLNNVKV